MKIKTLRDTLFQHEQVNFLLTNRVPRMLLTRWMGRISKIKQPWVAATLITIWKAFSDLDLREARKTGFESLHDCFVRELKDGARPIDQRPNVLCSPSDGIVMAFGSIAAQTLVQAKGLTYTLADLLGDADLGQRWEGGCYVTLRLTSSMYHRFHAPHDLVLDGVTHIHGDTWNVNPVALKRIARLYCRNERAVIHLHTQDSGAELALVAVAAILVAGIRLHCLPEVLTAHYRGPTHMACSQRAAKGEELGWFEHGSTIIVLAPKGFDPTAGLAIGGTVRMGQALLLDNAKTL